MGVRMLRRGALLGLALLGLVQGGPGGPVDQCAQQCKQVYSINQANFEQVRPSLDACQAGCQFFGRIEARNGFQDTLGNLQSCNQSCDKRFDGALLPACQSGCGFHFDSNVSAQRSSQLTRQGPSPPAPIFTRGPPPPPPTFPRARGPTFIRTQGPPRPTVFLPQESSQTWQETPRTSITPQTPAAPRMSQAPTAPIPRANIPSFLNIFRAPGPVMLRPQSFNATPQRVTPVMGSPPSQANVVTKENPRGPTIIGFSLPQLLSRVQNIIPRMEQAMPRMQKMPTMEEIFSKMEEPEVDEDVEIFDEGHPRFEGRPSFEFNLPSMGRVFEEIGEALPKMEHRIEPLMNRVMEIEIENPFEEFEETPRMSMTRFPLGNFLGERDRDDDFDFGGLFDQLTNQIMSSQFSRSWSPFGHPEVGKLTVIKAGPGFHDEKHYDIGPNGKLTEISEIPIHKDALEHENPMGVHFNSNDVEVFHTEDKPTESAVKATEAEKQEEEIASEPVMDVWAVEEEEENKEPELKAGESVEFQPKSLPFLAVLRNTVEENERMSQQLLQRYRTLAEQEYRDDYTCNSDHLKWSDWVACLHARVGVPRWLTAATISLGIVFSVWLCLVIPSAAPKQRIRALVIKTEKPSAALAKAKEAEAASKACEAAGVDPKMVVSVVRVDLPPSYGEVRPASPAPSYMSDMGVPASPAPSYRSVAPATKEEDAEEKVVLEPVHGEEEKKKDSVA